MPNYPATEVDYTNVLRKPELPEGLSFQQYSENHLETLKNMEENRFEIGLANKNYSNVHWTAFYDTSKISSNTGTVISTGSSGNAKLKRNNQVYFDSQSNSKYYGGYELVKTIQYDGYVIEHRNKLSDGGNGSANCKITFYYQDGTSASESGGPGAYTTEPTEVVYPNPNPEKEVDYVEVYLEESYGDDVAYEEDDEGIAYSQSGTIVMTEKSVDYEPEKFYVDVDAQTDADTSGKVVIRDGNGNTVTFDESEWDSEKSVSFSSTSYTAEIQPSTQVGSKTPTIERIGVETV